MLTDNAEWLGNFNIINTLKQLQNQYYNYCKNHKSFIIKLASVINPV